MTQQDFYNILGISKRADDQQIKDAYRKLARRYHPDVNSSVGAEERFKQINEAYQVLSDPGKRRRYDHFGPDWERYRTTGDHADSDPAQWFTNGMRGTAKTRDGTRAGDQRGSGASFESIFRSRQQGHSRRGEDHEAPVEISLREAFGGTTRMFSVTVPSTCTTCEGTGLRRSGVCLHCGGTGKSTAHTKLEVTIPPAVRDGHRVRVAGKGSPGIGGGPSGDVYLRIGIRADPDFDLDDVNLRTDVDVPLYTALLGGEVLVNTLTGRLVLTIPEATQNRRIFRLRGHGWPTAPRSEIRGDLLVRVHVRLPHDLSDEERVVFTRLRDAIHEHEGRSSA